MTNIGRPKKAEHEKRTDRLPASRVTRAERISAELKAEEFGMDLSDWIRCRAIDAPTPRKAPPADTSLITELNRIGNNVNQIARQLNRGRSHEPEYLAHTLSQLDQVLETLVKRYDP